MSARRPRGQAPLFIPPTRHRPRRWVPLLLLMAVVLVGCATAHRQPALDHPTGYSLGTDEIGRMNEMILAQAQLGSDPGEYLLGQGDLLRISVFEAQELDATVRVSSRGFVTLPLIGKVQVKGLSAMAAEEKIEALYGEKYIKDPHVSIFIEEHISQRITLVGQFKTPGTYDYPVKRRLLDVIALGGGLSDTAGPTVQVRQYHQGRQAPTVFMVDLDRLISRGDTQLNIEINGGDVLFIPEAGVFFVDGAVRRPGSYAIKHRTALMEALVEAGGIQPWAATERIKLVRLDDAGQRRLIELDLNQPGTGDIVIRDRDIVLVEASGLAGFMSGFGLSIFGTGFTYSTR